MSRTCLKLTYVTRVNSGVTPGSTTANPLALFETDKQINDEKQDIHRPWGIAVNTYDVHQNKINKISSRFRLFPHENYSEHKRSGYSALYMHCIH